MSIAEPFDAVTGEILLSAGIDIMRAKVEQVPNSQDWCVALPNDGPVLFQSPSEYECYRWLGDKQLSAAFDPDASEPDRQRLTGEILPPLAGEITAYDPFRAQLADAEKQNAALHFDYESKQGNKAARSHVADLRKVKGDLERARKAEKEESLQRGRKIDAEAKEIEARLEAMIEVHAKPLQEIEQREKDRLAAIQSRVDELRNSFSFAGQPSSEDIAAALARVKAVAIDDSFAEYLAQAAIAKDEAITALEALLVEARQREADAAELLRLQNEEAERQRIAREAQIAADAAAAATKAAEDAAAAAAAEVERKAQAERDAAAARELTLHRQAQEAEERARKAADAARQRIADEKAAQDAADAQRQADKEHRLAVNTAALNAVIALGLTEDQARMVMYAIVKGEVPNVSINY